tara:strand:+ start:462 stop:707 length:246 start_codon:yes stop_codon:yes gene_type:complete
MTEQKNELPIDYSKHYEVFHRLNKNKLREIRHSYGLNQTELARMLGYTNKTYISLWETGRRRIPKPIAFLLNLLQYKKDNL